MPRLYYCDSIDGWPEAAPPFEKENLLCERLAADRRGLGRRVKVFRPEVPWDYSRPFLRYDPRCAMSLEKWENGWRGDGVALSGSLPPTGEAFGFSALYAAIDIFDNFGPMAYPGTNQRIFGVMGGDPAGERSLGTVAHWLARGQMGGDGKQTEMPMKVVVLDANARVSSIAAGILATTAGVLILDISPLTSSVVEPGGSRVKWVSDADEYVNAVRAALAEADQWLGQATRRIVFFVAGAGFHEGSTHGVVGVTDSVLATRDEVVMRWASEKRIPVAYVIGDGGRGDGLELEHVASLHQATVELAALAATEWWR